MKADKSNHCAYNKKLQPLAKALRKRMTKSECCLWKYALKARKMRGYSFRRQRPVAGYIADFMCKDLKLIIELDGITHNSDGQVLKDIQKTDELEKLGFTVLRFADAQVLNDMHTVINHVEAAILKLERAHPLNPPPAGESRRHG